MDPTDKRSILRIVRSQNELALATVRPDGYPQANTVSYVNDGLTLYFATPRDSQKVKNLQHSNKVSLAISVPYADWREIRGLSMAATGEILADDSAESRHAAQLIQAKYPAVMQMPPPGDPAAVVYVKIVPRVISLLDYRKGFGHTELLAVGATDVVKCRGGQASAASSTRRHQ